MWRFVLLAAVIVFLAACSQTRRYELEGQVVAVDPAKQELTVRHKDIKGFMPGMTMPFKVTDKAVLAERKPGDLIKATLAVTESTGRLENVVKIGEAPLLLEEPVPRVMNVLDVGALAPDAEFQDPDGNTRRLSNWRGRVVAVTFVYTRCPVPDFCPRMDRNFGAVQRAILEDPARASRMHLLSVSFDPQHDTPAVLRVHAKRVGANPATWTWLTGEREAIDAFASAFGISIIRDDRPAQEIVHNLRTAVLDREGRITKIFSGNEWTPEELLAALLAADAR